MYEAKVRLFDDIKGLNLESKLPHIPLRRVGEGRLTNEVDDLLSMFTSMKLKLLINCLHTLQAILTICRAVDYMKVTYSF